MSKIYYCAKCGTQLTVTRKALPGRGWIVELVEYHKCSTKVKDFDLEPLNVPTFDPDSEDRKFVKKLNDLPRPFDGVSTMDLRDRRLPDQVKSSAPPTVLDQMKHLTNTTPVHDIDNELPDEIA